MRKQNNSIISEQSLRRKRSSSKRPVRPTYNPQRLNKYTVLDKIGEGASATVYRAKKISSNRVVAIKKISQQSFQSDKKLKKLFHKEASILKQCNNINVVKCFEKIMTKNYIYVVMEYCNGGDLQKYIQNNGKIPQQQAIMFLREILNGFKGLHEVGAMHRDFKLPNILLHDGICKICDLGFAKQVDSQKQHYQKHSCVSRIGVSDAMLGTTVTMAPQVLQGKVYGFQADIWSIGAVFYEMLYANCPFIGRNDYQVLRNIKKNELEFPKNVKVSEYSKDFIKRCLTYDPQKRICWRQIYQHPLINIKNRKQNISTESSNRHPLLEANEDLGFDEKQNQKFYEETLLVQKKRDQQFDEALLDSNISNSLQNSKQYQLHTPVKTHGQQLQFQSVVLINSIKFQKDVVTQKDQPLDEQIIQKYQQYFQNKAFPYKNINLRKQMITTQQINHNIPCYLISKQVYFELKDISQKMSIQRNILQIDKPIFKQLCESTQYAKLCKQLTDLMQQIQKNCSETAHKIKVCPEFVRKELDLDEIHSYIYNDIVRDIMKDYQKVLIENLYVTSGKQKKMLIKYIHAVRYYNSQYGKFNNKDYEQQQKQLDFSEYQKELLNKLNK